MRKMMGGAMSRYALWVIPFLAILGCESRLVDQNRNVPSKVGDHIQEGIQHLQQANTVEAIKSFDEAIKNNPTDPSGYIILGETYMRLQEYNRAVDSLNAASRVAPDKGEIFYLLAINYGLLGKRDLAKENAQKSVEKFRLAKDEENFLRSLALLQGLMQPEQTKSQ
jgi:tetratricopeptide (TPR) repeat protein